MSPAQCRAARALINFTQPRLAATAGVGLSTVVDFERERRRVSSESIQKITQALVAAGIDFIPKNGGGLGVRLRSPS